MEGVTYHLLTIAKHIYVLAASFQMLLKLALSVALALKKSLNRAGVRDGRLFMNMLF